MLKRLQVLILFYILLAFSPTIISAQVVINEFSSWEKSGDWVELYAYDDTNISGWLLRDSLDTTKIFTLPDNTIIGPGSSPYFVAVVGNRLNKDKDTLRLLKSDDKTLIDQIKYGSDGEVCAPQEGQSVGRVNNGNTIERFSLPTKGASNVGALLDPCPIPTSLPTATPQPTYTVAPTPTPKPISTIKPTAKPTLKPTTKPTLTPRPSLISDESKKSDERDVLGIETKTSPTQTEVNDAKKGKIPVAAGLFVLSGISFIGAAVYPMIKNRKKRYNKQIG